MTQYCLAKDCEANNSRLTGISFLFFLRYYNLHLHVNKNEREYPCARNINPCAAEVFFTFYSFSTERYFQLQTTKNIDIY